MRLRAHLLHRSSPGSGSYGHSPTGTQKARKCRNRTSNFVPDWLNHLSLLGKPNKMNLTPSVAADKGVRFVEFLIRCMQPGQKAGLSASYVVEFEQTPGWAADIRRINMRDFLFNSGG